MYFISLQLDKHKNVCILIDILAGRVIIGLWRVLSWDQQHFFLTCLGNDENENIIYEELKRYGTEKGAYITKSNNSLAIIEVAKSEENRIGIYSGANSKLTSNLILQYKNEV